MQIKTTVAKLEKKGWTIEQDVNKFYATKEGNDYTIGFFNQEGSLVCLNVTNNRALEADTHPSNANCYTSYPTTLKGALASAV